jgi:ATP-dependent Clp protease, protease subunit
MDKESGMHTIVNAEEFTEGMKKMLVGTQIQEQMLKRREIFLWGAIDDDSAREVVQKLLFFDGEGTDDITLYLNSPGGMISSGLAIYDAMQFIKSDVSTVCMGQAASMGAVLLCAGARKKRKAWMNARILIHQPLISGNMYGPASDLQIQAEEMLRLRQRLNEILTEHTGQQMSKVEQDTDRDFFMSAREAKAYGIVDEVVEG